MSIYSLLIVFFCFSAHPAQFGLSYYSEKVAINYPEKKMLNDKYATLIIENKMMSNLVLQVLREDRVVGNRIVQANQTNNLIVEHDKKYKYFVRTVQPALELIELKFTGRKIEIP